MPVGSGNRAFHYLCLVTYTYTVVVRTRLRRWYTHHLKRQIDNVPSHIAVIQDGNRRYADSVGADHRAGYQAGAETTESLLEWSREFGIEELTLYTFSTENFNRAPEERAAIFELIEEKLTEFARSQQVHENEVRIRVIGQLDRLPASLRDTIATAEAATAAYDQFVVNIAIAYGGRATLLEAAQKIVDRAADGTLPPASIDRRTVEEHLYDEPLREVDLIIRTGGTRRTSNFLPWLASGNQAAVYFCTPYWPEFSRVDFLRGLRTYQHREASWQQTRLERALALLRAIGDVELTEARRIAGRLRGSVQDHDLPQQPADD